MDPQIQAAIIGAIIGAALSAGMGLLLDVYREWKKEKRLKDILVTAICDDLRHSDNVYDAVIKDWNNEKIVYFSRLIELKESRQTYQNNKDWIHIFSNASLRREIFTYYLETANCFNALEFNQKRKYEIDKIFNDTLASIKSKYPSLKEEKHKELALAASPNEAKEYMQIDNFMANNIIKLATFKSTAKDLISNLSKIL